MERPIRRVDGTILGEIELVLIISESYFRALLEKAILWNWKHHARSLNLPCLENIDSGVTSTP